MTTLETARGYVAAGISVIPIKADGTKAPALSSWNPYRERLAADEELIRWFVDDRLGIAILCGAVSGGLEVVDFDSIEAFNAWAADLERQRPGSLALFPIVATPAGGRHVYYRTPKLSGNQKLALSGKKAAAETRGEGGYVLAPGSPAACHPTGGTYRHVAGPPITELPTI